ncbi:MAG: c-type cytochrome biogenesis protein CcmI [Hyphomicrobiales bacterium]|nr:c-type cytochrome biogenesis protein CcmI [Hyphomicrobiales bacterium]
MFWIVMAGLTALVLAAVLMPVMRSGRTAAERGAYDVQIFRDQLAELERDAAAGLIDQSAADAARNEISRRILSAEKSAQEARSDNATPGWVSTTALVAIPVLALVGYLNTGRPDLPDQPRAERMANAVEAGDMPAMIVKVEEHLAAYPNDAKGWIVLAPAYRRLGRYTDAAEAFRKGILFGKPDAALMTEYGETLVLIENGMITAKAREVFDGALALDPAFAKARFYRALADSQDGKTDEAEKRFKALLADAPADAPWRTAVERQLAELSPAGKGPALDADTVKNAEEMSATDRQQMIAGMVDRLAERLQGNGDDLDGWLRLINARMVLGQKDKASEALNSAREQFKANKDALAQLDVVSRRHNLKATQ